MEVVEKISISEVSDQFSCDFFSQSFCVNASLRLVFSEQKLEEWVLFLTLSWKINGQRLACRFVSGFQNTKFNHNNGVRSLMVKRLVVNQVHAGSNPVGHPRSCR